MVFQELTRGAEIQNNLVGNVKMANEEQQEDFNSVDKNSVKLMKTPGGASGTLDENAARATAAAASGRTKTPPPAAVSPEAVEQLENYQKHPLKGSANNAAAASATSPPQP